MLFYRKFLAFNSVDVSIRTLENVKLSSEVKEVKGFVNLIHFDAFFSKHFENVNALRPYLKVIFQSDFDEDLLRYKY